MNKPKRANRVSHRRTDPNLKPFGAALLCSPDSVVTHVVYDGVGMFQRTGAGTLLGSIFEPRCIPKSESFVRSILDNHDTEHCALDIVLNGRALPLWFSGSYHAGVLKVACARTPAGADEIWRQYLPDENRQPAVASSGGPAPQASPNIRTSPEREIAAGHPELLQRNIALENISREKTRWLLTATHDLRNQLYAVRSYAELLSEEPADCQGLEQKKILEYLYGSVESMMHLLSDLTEIASTEEGNTRLHISSTTLLPLLDECISICRPSARRKDIQLSRVCREPLPAINIDPERIQQVCVELIDNAIKYSRTGAKVELDAVRNDRELRISVRDNGPGIPPDELQSIFTPFQKTRARAACMEPGTGLGLAICKRTVEQHEGRIWAESTLGEGTTFHVVLSYDPSLSTASSDQRA